MLLAYAIPWLPVRQTRRSCVITSESCLLCRGCSRLALLTIAFQAVHVDLTELWQAVNDVAALQRNNIPLTLDEVRRGQMSASGEFLR